MQKFCNKQSFITLFLETINDFHTIIVVSRNFLFLEFMPLKFSLNYAKSVNYANVQFKRVLKRERLLKVYAQRAATKNATGSRTR